MNNPTKPVIEAYNTVRHLLNTLKTLDQKLPQVIEALSLIAQLQQDISELSARNSQLERELTEAERHNFELSKQIQSEEAWRTQLDKLEKCQTAKWYMGFQRKRNNQPSLLSCLPE